MTIYRDALGIPQPVASIRHFGGSWGQGGFWAMSSTALDIPAALDAHYESPEAAELAAIEAGWVVIDRGVDGYNCPWITISHPETAAALEAAIARSNAKWAKATPCYVRYGKLPRGGKSRNHATGEFESGVSVFRGEVLPSGEARALPDNNVLAASMVSLRDRDLYVVSGVEIGTGSDGEPVLKNCKIIAKSTK